MYIDIDNIEVAVSTDWSRVGESGGEDWSRSLSASVAAVSARARVIDRPPHGTETDIRGSEYCLTSHCFRSRQVSGL